MSSRALALLFSAVGAGALLFLVQDEPATAPGLVGGLLALAAIWLTSGRLRTALAVIAALLWLLSAGLALSGSPWAVAAAAAGLAGAVLTVVKGRDWPGFSTRYARGAAAGDEDADPRHLWESLDRGVDPTQGPDADGADKGSG